MQATWNRWTKSALIIIMCWASGWLQQLQAELTVCAMGSFVLYDDHLNNASEYHPQSVLLQSSGALE